MTDPRSNKALYMLQQECFLLDRGSVLVIRVIEASSTSTTRICPTLSKFNDRARVNEVLSLPEVV